MSATKTICRTPTPGKEGITRILAWKFDLVRRIILELIDQAGPDGVPFSELPGLVSDRMSPDERARLGSVAWHVTTVKLELEVAGEVRRTEDRGPQRLTRP